MPVRTRKFDGELVYKAFISAGQIKNYETFKKNGFNINKEYTWNQINDMMVKGGASFIDCSKMNKALEEWARKPHYEDLVYYESKKVEKMKTIVEAKTFDKIVRARLKTMLEAVVELPDGEQRNVTPEEMEQLKASGVEFQVVQNDINTEVDKETWGQEEKSQNPETIDNSEIVSVDDEKEDEEPQNIMDFLTGEPKDEVKPNEPAVLNEFGDLSNEEKKALLLQLAKDDNDLDAILKAYLTKKMGVNEEGSEEEAMKNTQDVGSSNTSVITK